MIAVYRTYAPSGDIDHPTFSAMIDWIGENDDDIYRVVKTEYIGAVTWDEDEMQASGNLVFAVDDSENVAGWLRSYWEVDDEMLENNPPELVYKYENVDQMRQERIDLIEEERGNPTCGGM